MYSVDEVTLNCTVHNLCEHFETFCQCNICWTHLAQCPDYNGGSPEPYMGLARPKKPTRLPNNNKLQGDTDLYCTEEICDSPDWSNSTNRRNNLGIDLQEERELYPQLYSGEGTSPYLKFSFPNIERQRQYILDANKHFESVNQKYADRVHVTGHQREIISLLDLFDMDSNGESERGTEVLQGTIPNTPVSGNNNEISTNDSPIDRNESTTTPMATESDDTIEPRVPARKRSRSGSKSNDEYHTGDSNASEMERAERIKQKKVKRTASTSKEKTSTMDDYYTFIIHKKYQRDDWRTARCKGPTPNFVTIDHGDHYHIIFTNKGESNIGRTRKRITEYLGLGVKGSAEATATFTKIRLLTNFILYCLRYGIRTVNHYGSKIMHIVKQIEDLFETQADDVDTVELDAICRPYIEEKREEREVKKRMGKNKLKTITEVIADIIKEKNITTYGQWETRLDKKTKLYLLSEYGLSVETYIKLMLRMEKAEKTQDIRNKSIIEIMLSTEEFKKEEELADVEICDWIETWLEENELDITDLLTWIEVVRNKKFKKINGLVLQGPTNAGKSLFMRTITELIKPEQIPRENDNSQFKLDQLPTATSAIFEEPMITPNNVGTWKLLLEGATVSTDIKNKDKETIPRIPIFITTECAIDKHIDNREGEQIRQRIKIFRFRKGIQHLDDSTARTADVRAREIPAAPGQVGTKHFYMLYLKYWNLIQENIKGLEKIYIRDSENEILYPIDIEAQIKCARDTLTKK
uniref:Nonstructural protein 1 n=1 Tax=Phylloscopus proregulus Brevihamaparvovirus TaxID=2794566 RepID=A0A8A4XD31_9VIRU|nr:MAG: nonstructural protein 1 [Phylloscopus proregulus Brevihamaparvovirus]